jgi:hypothetical protein
MPYVVMTLTVWPCDICSSHQSVSISPAVIMVIPRYKSAVPPPRNQHTQQKLRFILFCIYLWREAEYGVPSSMLDDCDKFTVAFAFINNNLTSPKFFFTNKTCRRIWFTEYFHLALLRYYTEL